jgi:uncharacterized protein DUF2332
MARGSFRLNRPCDPQSSGLKGQTPQSLETFKAFVLSSRQEVLGCWKRDERKPIAFGCEHQRRLARRNPPILYRGDLVELLPDVASQVPGNLALCVYHTAVLVYLPIQRRHRERVGVTGIE